MILAVVRMSGSIENGSLTAEHQSLKSMILATALVVRLIYLENAESENLKKNQAKKL